MQGCRLDAILVLRIQGGNDIFCSISGAYAPSFFGVSLPTLAGLPRHALLRVWPNEYGWHCLVLACVCTSQVCSLGRAKLSPLIWAAGMGPTQAPWQALHAARVIRPAQRFCTCHERVDTQI